MLEILIPATNRKLTTVTAVKIELEISGNQYDAFLSDLIDQASSIIEQYCDRTFAREKYKETLPGFGTKFLSLSKTPICHIESVKLGEELITDYKIYNANAGILYRERGWGWTVDFGWNITYFPIPGSEKFIYEVIYEAGYILPGEPQRNLPFAIERACIEIVKQYFIQRSKDPSIESESLGDYQVSHTLGLTPLVKEILTGWRRIK